MKERKRVQIDCSDSILVEQHHKSACDVNVILSKYEATGIITHGTSKKPRYGDFTTSSDYLDACLKVKIAEDSFASLPSAIRARFQNDPASFIDFVNDEKNHDECVKYGLIDAKLINDNVPNIPASDVESELSQEPT